MSPFSICVRAPLRISYGGGGTDLDAYYNACDGLVLNTAISLYATAIVESIPSGIEISAPNFPSTARADSLGGIPDEPPFRLGRAALQALWNSGRPVRVTLATDVPVGSGLGASCALVVALVRSLGEANGLPLRRDALAEKAYEVDVVYALQASGKQDHYAAALGGLNAFRFTKDGVQVRSLAVDADTARRLEEHTMLFFGGQTRESRDILVDQRKRSAEAGRSLEALHAAKSIAEEMIEALESGDVEGVGTLLGRAWEQKQHFAEGISNPRIQEAHDIAMQAGALGAKIAGAGAGGHLIIMASPNRQDALRVALEAKGWSEVPFRFEAREPTVLYGKVTL